MASLAVNSGFLSESLTKPRLPRLGKLAWVDAQEVGRRIRLAREWAGYARAKELADVLEMSEGTLLHTEQGKRRASRIELWAIARVCNVPEEFFSAEAVTPADLLRSLERLPPAPPQEEPEGG